MATVRPQKGRGRRRKPWLLCSQKQKLRTRGSSATPKFVRQDAAVKGRLVECTASVRRDQSAPRQIGTGFADRRREHRCGPTLRTARNAQWEPDQTTVRAPAAGYVSAMAL